MTDSFALLGQPRRPWLDADELKQAFHARSLHAHPDAQPAGSEATAFTELNEAHQVLQDPKRRLQHLLRLEGVDDGSGSNPVPDDIEKLFPRVAEVTQQAHQLPQQFANTTSSLSRALARPQLIEIRQCLAEMLQLLRERHAESVARLQQLDQEWEQDRQATLPELRQLYLRFSYLSRWIGELEEKQRQLSAL
jgi:curved DNA-binding protein CbpA